MSSLTDNVHARCMARHHSVSITTLLALLLLVVSSSILPAQAPNRTHRAPGSRGGQNVRQVGYNEYLPAHLQTAQMPSNFAGQPPIVGGHSGGQVMGTHHAVGGPVDEFFDAGYVDAGFPVDGGFDACGCGSCDSCVTEGCATGFCDSRSQGVCGCGDFQNCPVCRECWLSGVGGLICNTELFVGAHSFDSIVDTTALGRPLSSQFGFHSGVNIGLPLQRLTCGLVSGQVGASIHQSEYGGDDTFTFETREQVFLTAGLFRRVDYGFQFGVVYDILFEDWIYRTELGQVRGELSYLYGNGSQFGFRFGKGVQDGGPQPVGVTPDVLDNYRFFWRMPAFHKQGFADIYYGFTEESHSIVGAATDIGLTQRIAVQSGFTYVWEDETVDDGYNMYMRLVFRPAARNWYRNYHRPLLPVADNGSLLTILR